MRRLPCLLTFKGFRFGGYIGRYLLQQSFTRFILGQRFFDFSEPSFDISGNLRIKKSLGIGFRDNDRRRKAQIINVCNFIDEANQPRTYQLINNCGQMVLR